MKSFKVLALLLSLATITLTQSCKDTAPVTPAPTVTANNVSAIVGSTAKVAATISVPAGLKSITVTKNGGAFDSVVGKGETSYDYTKDFALDNTLTSGSVVTFMVKVTDNQDRTTEQTLTVTVSAKQIVVVPAGNITANTTWTADKIYKLQGYVRVGAEAVSGTITAKATLTIEPGTLIIGERESKGTLIVHRGSKLIAEGTAAKPIVFTSERAVGERLAGDWGGIVLCGQAPNNLPAASRVLEGGYSGFHGGDLADDNSGVLKYVRIEYAGVPLQPNAELNSLTMGSVGSGTTIDYVQASYGLDDSFEWFGGTVNAKHLIAYKGLDDDFDVDNGYSGYVQYAIGIRGATEADQSGSNGFEVDNDGRGNAVAPYTSGTFANVSIIGAKGLAETSINTNFQNGLQLRRNNKLKIYNTLVTGYPNGLYIDSQLGDARANAVNGELVVKNVVLAGVKDWGTNGWGTGFATNPKGVAVVEVEQNAAATAFLIGGVKPETWFTSIAGNKVITKSDATGLSSSLWLTGRPTFTLTAASTDLKNIALPTTLPAFFDKTTYVGAFNDTDWTATWAEFSPQAVVYVK